VDPQLRQDVRRVVQRLRQILEPAPHQQVERPWIGRPRPIDDPARAFGRLPHAGVGRHFGLALLGDRPQRVGRRIAIRVPAQVRVVARVLVDHLEDVVLPPRPVRRRDQALQVEDVGVEQQVRHRLLIVGIGPADVRRHEHAVAHAIERALRARRLRGSEPAGQEHDRDDGAGDTQH
jgi:hypothetical protein